MGAKAKRNRLSMALTPHAKHALRAISLRSPCGRPSQAPARFAPISILHKLIPHSYHFAK